MKRFYCLPILVALTFLGSCEKPPTDAEKNAEVERRVQERLTTERQAAEQQRLTQAQMDLDQRLKQVEARNATVAAATPLPETQTGMEPEPAAQEPAGQGPDEGDDSATADYSTFYTRLAPQGEWRETENYGYVWQPRVAEGSRDWRPYTNGRWVYTDAGWTWISEEPFGWATYHYGRWTRLQRIGWVWVPGNEWAPAWVSWRKSSDYVGWAPLPPEARFERKSGIHNWADNYYDIGPDQYAFVPVGQLGDQRVEQAVVPVDRNVAIISLTTNITNITYNRTTIVNAGPNYDEMRGRSRQPIARMRLERQESVNLDAGDLRSVVRGDVVQVKAPPIARARKVERPQIVKETVGQAVVDHGWERVGDRQAAEKVRAKMKSEATPPPNAPSKTFVKPANAAVAAPRPVASATPALQPSVFKSTPQRIAQPAPEASVRREFPSRTVPDVSPVASATAAPSPAPTARVVATPVRPAVSPTSTPIASDAVNSPIPHVNRTTPVPAISPRRSFPTPSPSVASEAATIPTPPPVKKFDRTGEARELPTPIKRLPTPESPAARPVEALPQATNPPAPKIPGHFISAPAATTTPAAPSPTPAVSERAPLPPKEPRREGQKPRRPGNPEGTPSPSAAPQ